MRLDSLQYFTPEHPPEHLGPILKRNRFDGSITVWPDAGHPRESIAVVQNHDFVKAVIPSVDLDDPGVWSLLDKLSDNPKFCGIFYRLGKRLPDGLAELARRGLRLDLQVTASQLPLVSEIAAKFPKIPLAILHLGSPEIGTNSSDEWARDMASLAHYPQVFCKASDLIHLAAAPWKGADLRPYMQHVLARFTPARVMFGSGWPSGLPDHIWKETLAAFTQAIGAQSMEVREELLGGTAQRFYGLAPL